LDSRAEVKEDGIDGRRGKRNSAGTKKMPLYRDHQRDAEEITPNNTKTKVYSVPRTHSCDECYGFRSVEQFPNSGISKAGDSSTVFLRGKQKIL